MMAAYLSRLFLHYFDIHHLESISPGGLTETHRSELRLATRLAVVSADTVFIPASSYIEADICGIVIRELFGLFELGIVRLSGSGGNLHGFRAEHLEIYRTDSPQASAYRQFAVDDLHPPFAERQRSSTLDITEDWLTRATLHIPRVTRGLPEYSTASLQERWATVPAGLGATAFIVSYAQEVLGPESRRPTVVARLHRVINEAYFASFTRELQAGVVTDLIYLDTGLQIPTFAPSLPFKALVQELRRVDLLRRISGCSTEELMLLREEHLFRQALGRALEGAGGRGWTTTRERGSMSTIKTFIVHGHDRELLFDFKDYLQNTLGLPEPIILEQQPDGGRTIIEKFEEYASEVDMAFVLLTPDDAVEDGKSAARARQNVIFELGYFLGHFGRRSGRVVLIHKGELNIPSDLSGVVYVPVARNVRDAGEKIRLEIDNAMTRAR